MASSPGVITVIGTEGLKCGEVLAVLKLPGNGIEGAVVRLYAEV